MGGLPGFSGSKSSGGGLPGFSGKKKPAKKKGGGSLGHALDVVVDDAKGLAVGSAKSAYETTRDTTVLFSPFVPPKRRLKALKNLGKQAAGVAQGVEEIIPNPQSLPYGDVSLVQWNGSLMPDFWVRGGEAGDSARAARAWKTHPLTSAVTAVGVVAPGVGALEIGRLASSIMEANRTFSRAHALNLARRESRNPGYLAAQGISGGLEPRTVKSRIPGGKTREVELPQARSAVGRRGQAALDAASRKLPEGAPLSERRRANRQIAREIQEQERRHGAHAAVALRPVKQVAFHGTGRSRPGHQAMLAYALQTPRKAGDPFHGPRAVADRLGEILDEGGYVLERDQHGQLWHKLSPTERRRLTVEHNRIRKALANPPDADLFEAAVDAMERLSAEAENVGRYVAQGRARGVTREQAARLDKVFDERRNLLSKYLGMEGEARGFFPHRSKFAEGGGAAAASRGAGSVIGRPQPKGISLQRNRLRLFESGKLDTNPGALEHAYTARMRFLDAEQQRRALFDEAVPLDQLTGNEKGGYLIRDPDRSPATLTDEHKQLAHPAHAKRQVMQMLDEGEEQAAWDHWREQWLRHAGPVPEEWAGAPDSVRWLPADVVNKRLPKRVSIDPDAKGRPLLATLNALARVATITGKPARYVLTNSAQNIVTATITSPRAVARGIRMQAGLARAVPAVDRIWRALRLPDGLRSRRPDLYDLIASETGDVTATAGLPTVRTASNRMQQAEAAATKGQQWLGEKLGSVADTPYRVAVWMGHARRRGFKTDQQLERLLTSDAPAIQRARRQILTHTRDDMYDFNRLSVWERDTISRFFFLWPLVRAGVRWPVTYTRDYPVRAGALAASTLDDKQPAEQPQARDLFKFATKGGMYDTGWAVPHQITVEQLENLQRVLHGDFLAVGGMLSPPLAQTGQALFGFDRPLGQRLDRAGRQLVPGYATVEDIRRQGVRGVPVAKRFTPQQPAK